MAAVVTDMMEAVESRYPLAQRWFRAKAEALGLDVLALGDQYAPMGESRPVGYDEGRALVDCGLRRLRPAHPRRSPAAFFSEQRVDAEPRAGKRGGAFCAPVAQDARPYVMLNYTDRMNDVLTLAHELGHGMHFQLSHDAQTPHSAHTGLALAEVPSTFAEFVATDHLLAGEQDRATRRRSPRAGSRRRSRPSSARPCWPATSSGPTRCGPASQALTAERLSEIWIEQNGRYYGDSVQMPDGYRLGWAYIPHFISTRFYTYAYVFAKLVALALYARWREQGEEFVPAYLEFLSAGGSASPTELLAPLGIDLAGGGIWDNAFGELERMIEAAERETSG